jgi:hypothetical protein
MDEKYVDLLNAVRVDLDDRDELEARRSAAKRRLLIEVCDVKCVVASEPLSELHLLLPSGRCIAVLHLWPQIERLIERLRPIMLRKVIARARPCALHPTPSAFDCGPEERELADWGAAKGAPG